MASIQRLNYLIFGIKISSSFPLSFDCEDFSGESDIEFLVTSQHDQEDIGQEFIYASPYRDMNGLNHFRLYRSHGNFLMYLSSGIIFTYLGNQIICSADDPSDPGIEIGLLGAVLAFWLEMHQITTLHASAVAANNRSLIFLAESLSGKSSLAASFLQAGFSFLSDDIVPIERSEHGFLSRPGYPILKLWPSEASHFLGNTEGMPKENPESEKLKIKIGPNGFGQLSPSSTPIGCFYIPERIDLAEDEPTIQIIPTTPRDAVIEILRFSFAARMAEAAGYAAARLTMISEITRTIPVKRLIYPSGHQYLPLVRDAILSDLS